MRIRIIALALLLTGTAFSMDEYQPVEKGKLEVDLGYQLLRFTGVYNDEGDHFGNSGDYSPTVHGFGLQLKYGILPRLDVELRLTGVAPDEEADAFIGAGMTSPEIGLKYAIGPAVPGVAVYGNLALPFGAGDYQEPPLALELGAVYQNRWGDFRLTGRAGYNVIFERDDANKGDVFSLYVKPEAMWTEYIGTYLGVRADFLGGDEYSGNGADDNRHLVTLVPGINAQLTSALAYEINVPITVMGSNSLSFWGIAAQLYYTLP
jgi:hypothetical protein